MRKALIIALALLFVVVATVACENGEGAQESPEADPAVEAEAAAPETDDAQEPAEQEQEQAAAEDADFDYPGMDLSGLSDGERAQLAGVAGSELCPCPDAVVSLHECMQEEERCAEADEMAATLVGAVSRGAAEAEVFEQVAQERASDERVHQFTLEGSPYKGNPEADVIIVEFADFQCPHCRTASQIMSAVHQQFGDDIAIYFKNFPLGSPLSDEAARAAAAAHRQNRFWPMHELIFANQHQLTSARIQNFARQLGLNYERFQQDMGDRSLHAQIARDRQEGMSAGVQGTPALFINGQRYTGAFTVEAISSHVRAQLEES